MRCHHFSCGPSFLYQSLRACRPTAGEAGTSQSNPSLLVSDVYCGSWAKTALSLPTIYDDNITRGAGRDCRVMRCGAGYGTLVTTHRETTNKRLKKATLPFFLLFFQQTTKLHFPIPWFDLFALILLRTWEAQAGCGCQLKTSGLARFTVMV